MDTPMNEPEVGASFPDLPAGPSSDVNETNLFTPSPMEVTPTIKGHENDESIGIKAEEALPNEEPQKNVILSEEQQAVFNLVLEGQSVFFTGSAGEWESYSVYILSF